MYNLIFGNILIIERNGQREKFLNTNLQILENRIKYVLFENIFNEK